MEIFSLFGSILMDTSQADKSLAKTESGVKKAASALGSGIKTAAKWGAGIVTAAAGAAAAITKMASGFDDSFAKVQTLLKGAEEDIAVYKDHILQTSSKTGIAVKEMSEAVYSALSAGVDQSGVVEFAEKANKLAKGGFTDIQTSVDVITTALNAYNMESKEAERVTDVLITTQNLGKTSVGELAASMGKIIPLASAYNVNIENLGASYATLTASGIATNESTTYMKALFTELSKESSKVSKILKEKTGKSFSELMTEGKSVGDVIAILSESVNKDATAFAGLWSSTQSSAGALAIMNKGTEEFNSTLEEMQGAAGATEKAFDTMENTLSAKIKKIKNNIANMGISLGEKLVPIVEKFVELALENLPVIQRSVEKLEPVLKSLLEGIVPVTMKLAELILPSIVYLVGVLIPLISNVMTSLSPIISALIQKLVPVAVKIIEKLLPPLVKILDALTPVLDVLFVLLDPILDVLSLLLDPLAEILTLAAELITVLINMAKTALEPLKPILDFLVEILKTGLSVGLQQAADLIQNVVIPYFKGFSSYLSGDFTGAIEGFGTGFVGIFEAAFSTIDSLFGTNFGKWYDEVTSFWKNAGAKLYEVLHADEISEIELKSKYGSLDSQIVQQSNQYMREGLSAAEAMEKAVNEVLDTSEKLYYFQNYLEEDMNSRFGTAEERYEKVSRQDLNSYVANEKEKPVDTASKEFSAGFQEPFFEITELANESTDEIARSFQGMNRDISDTNTAAIQEYKQKLDQTVSDTADSYDKMLNIAKQTQEDEVTAFKHAKDDELSALKKTNQKAVEDLKVTQKAQSEEIKARHKEESDLLKHKQAEELEVYKRGHSERISMIDEEYMEQLKLVDEETYNHLKAAQDEINAIDAKTAQENKAREEKRIKEERDALSRAVITAKDVEERQEAQKKLNEFDEEQNRKKALELREQRKEELEQEISNIKTTAEEKKKKLKQEHEERIASENEVFDIETRNLQAIHAIQTAMLSERQKEEFKELENVQKAALENLEAINKQKETSMKRLHENELTGLKGLHSQRLDDIRAEKEKTVEKIKEQNAIDLEEYKKLIAEKQKELDSLKFPENVLEVEGVKPIGGEMAAYYQRQGEAKLKESELPHYASGGITYGKTAAVIGDNQNAAIDPEVVAPLSQLQKMINNDEQTAVFYKILEVLEEILARIGEPQPMNVNLTLKNGTKFAGWVIDNINEIKRTTGREVFV